MTDLDTIDPSARRYWTLGRLALGALLIALVAFWGWIYLFAPRDNPDRLESRGFVATAETICASAQADINALPSPREAEDLRDRAAQVRAGTEITVRMVADLKAAAESVVVASDRAILDAWFEDWEDGYIVDRWRHVDKLETADPDSRAREDLVFLLQDRAEGGHYTRRIDGLANVNDMESCHVPGDV